MKVNTDIRVSIDDLPSNLYLVNEYLKIIHNKKDMVKGDLTRALELIKEKRKTIAGLGGIEHLVKNAITQREVYAVESGCRFEGGGINGIFSNLELARKRAQFLVQTENKYIAEANKKGDDFELYFEENPNNWLTSTSYIKVTQFKIIDSCE